jgi:hypothetical protein
LPYNRATSFSGDKLRDDKGEYLKLGIKVKHISFEEGKTLIERTETLEDFEKLYLNPSKFTGIQGKTSRTLLLPTEEVKAVSPALMFNVILDPEMDRYLEEKIGTGLLYMTSKRILFQVKPSNLKENYLQWSVEFREIREISTGIGFRFAGGPKERLQIKYSSDNEVKTVDFAAPTEPFLSVQRSEIFKPLSPKEWEDAILRQILKTEMSF